MNLKPFIPIKFRRRVFSQLWMLAVQFILGMLLNLIGGEATGAKHTIYSIVLIIHILNAIGLVEGGIYIALKERSRLSWWATITLFVTFCSGILMVLTRQDVWSFAMACGFLASSWLHGMLYIEADRRLYSTYSQPMRKNIKDSTKLK